MRENRTLIIIIAVVLFLLELEIFVLAATKSGRKSRMQVINAQGSIIHEADGDNLSQFNKYYFEKTFGPLEQYQVKLVTEEVPFPFRAWFAAAVGIPVGVILLFGFAVRAFQTLFYGEEQRRESSDPLQTEYEYRFEKIIAVVSRFNIFTIGFLALLVVFGYWVIPNLMVYAGQLGIETLTRYKWIFLTVGIIFLGLIVWILYLRYLLAKKSIEGQTEIDKYRLQLEYNESQKAALQLDYNQKETTDEPLAPGDNSQGNDTVKGPGT
jgi:hypothetical protein